MSYKQESFTTVASEPRSSYGEHQESPLTLISRSRAGVPMAYLLELLDHMDLSLSEAAYILNCSLRTLQRNKKEDSLDTPSSSKVLKLSSLNKDGLRTFNSQKAFNTWLKSPILALENAKPLELLDTFYGFEVLTQVLGRIRHGVFA